MMINKVFAYKSITLSMVIELNLRETKASENEYYYFCSQDKDLQRDAGWRCNSKACRAFCRNFENVFIEKKKENPPLVSLLRRKLRYHLKSPITEKPNRTKQNFFHGTEEETTAAKPMQSNRGQT